VAAVTDAAAAAPASGGTVAIRQHLIGDDLLHQPRHVRISGIAETEKRGHHLREIAVAAPVVRQHPL
jgi:hypothetical protein